MFCRSSDDAFPRKYRKKRNFTDFIFALIYIGYLAGLGVIFGICFGSGALADLWYKVDYLGYQCGKGTGPRELSSSIRESQYQSKNWSENTLLWFPLVNNHVNQTVTPGICVKKCPLLMGENKYASAIHLYGNFLKNGTEVPNRKAGSFQINYDSIAFYGWCIPVHRGLMNNDFTASFVENFLYGTVEVIRSWRVVATSMVISTAMSITYIHFLSKFTRFMIYVSSIGAACSIAMIGVFMYDYSKNTIQSADPIFSRLYFISALGSWFSAALGLIFFSWFRRKIDEACALIQISGRMVGANLRLIFVPITSLVLFLSMMSFFLCLAIMTLSLGEHILSQSARSYALAFASSMGYDSLLMDTSGSTVIKGVGIYLIFGFFWCSEILSSYCFMVLSFCYVFWYFSEREGTKTGDRSENSLPVGSLRKALKWTAFFHIGTIVIGSLIVTLIQVLEIFLRLVMFQASRILQKNQINRFLFYVTNFLVTISKKVLSFGTRNGYILTCITSKSFCRSTNEAFQILSDKFVTLIFLQFLKELILFIGKLLVIGGALLCSDFLFSYGTFASAGIVRFYPMIIIAASSYFISSSFFYLLSVSFHTTLMCFAYDSHYNRGCFAPSELRRFLVMCERLESRESIPVVDI